MAATQYQLFCRIINSVTNKAISNSETNRIWVSKFDVDNYNDIETNPTKYIKEVIEFETTGEINAESKMQEKIIEGSKQDNPKYDMIFVYSGCDVIYNDSDTKNYPYLLTDKMERVFMYPWFVHSTHSSLQSVMEKAQELVKKVGHSSIKIGKIVPLDQYIDIV